MAITPRHSSKAEYNNPRSPDRPAPPLKPRFMRLHQAVHYSGLSRSGIYRLISGGILRSCKAGSATLVDVGSLDAHLDSLPDARNA